MPPSATPPDGGPTIRPADAAAIADAAALLRAGCLVAFPTETVYGLGGDATDSQAVAAIFAAKDRPRFNPLISHYANTDAVMRDVAFDERARRLAAAFWPGPLTLVLPRRANTRLAPLVSSGLASVAVRVPAHPVAHALLAAVDRPVAAPSANRSGALSPTTAAHVAAGLGDAVAMIIDGDACPLGIESTVVDLCGAAPALLRPGAVIEDELREIVGPLTQAEATNPPRAPGMLARHYAPATPLRLDATGAAGDEALLAFGPDSPSGGAALLNLSPAGNLVEAAANLFVMLHTLDAGGHRAIAIAPIPDAGLGRAINDRLRRAATGSA